MRQKAQAVQPIVDQLIVPCKARTPDLKKQFGNSLKKIETILNLHSRDLTSEKIHDLRVEIKKIKALFHLLKSTTPKFSERKYLKPFKTLFQNAGKLRSVQVEFDLINSNFTEDQNTNYLHQLHEYKVKRHDELDELIKSGISKVILKNKKEITYFIKKITHHKIEKYFQNQEKYISHLLEKNIFREDRLHIIRKKLKRYYLNAKNIKDFSISNQWEMLLELLGEWHDHQVTLYPLIKVIHTAHLNPSETEQLNIVRLKLQKRKGKIFEQIISTHIG